MGRLRPIPANFNAVSPLDRIPGAALAFSNYGPATHPSTGTGEAISYYAWTVGLSDFYDNRWAQGTGVAQSEYIHPWFDGGAHAFYSSCTAVLRPWVGFNNQCIGDLYVACYQLHERNSDPNRALSALYFGDGTTMQVGSFTFPTSPGTLNVTGVGFQPDLVLFVGAHPSRTGGVGTANSLGACDAALNQWCLTQASAYVSGSIGLGAEYNQVRRRSQFVDGAAITHYGLIQPLGQTTQHQRAELTSMDADGFTLDFTAAAAEDGGELHRAAYIAMQGDFAVGVIEQGDTTISTSFAPESMIFASANTPNFSEQQWAYFSLGAVDPDSQRGIWGGSPSGYQGVRRFDASDAPTSVGESNTTHAIVLGSHDPPTAAGPDPVPTPTSPNARAQVTLTNTGATLNWTLDDAINRKIGWVAFLTEDGTDCQHPEAEMDAGGSCGEGVLTATILPCTLPGDHWHVWFQWGTTLAYGNYIDTHQNVSGDTPVIITRTIGPLQEGETYHARVVLGLNGVAHDTPVAEGSCFWYSDDDSWVEGPCFEYATIHETFGLDHPG